MGAPLLESLRPQRDALQKRTPLAAKLHTESVDLAAMIKPEEIVGEEWASWYRLLPQERWRESEKLWQFYFYLGGTLASHR